MTTTMSANLRTRRTSAMPAPAFKPGEASARIPFDFAVQLDQQPRQGRDEDEVGGGGSSLPHEQRQ